MKWKKYIWSNILLHTGNRKEMEHLYGSSLWHITAVAERWMATRAVLCRWVGGVGEATKQGNLKPFLCSFTCCVPNQLSKQIREDEECLQFIPAASYLPQLKCAERYQCSPQSAGATEAHSSSVGVSWMVPSVCHPEPCYLYVGAGFCLWMLGSALKFQ